MVCSVGSAEKIGTDLNCSCAGSSFPVVEHPDKVVVSPEREVALPRMEMGASDQEDTRQSTPLTEEKQWAQHVRLRPLPTLPAAGQADSGNPADGFLGFLLRLS